MQRDLTELLEEWPFESGQITVRLIEGRDGDSRIQVRLDLGLLQMCTHGRPDGTRPHGFDSLLDYFESKIDQDDLESELNTNLDTELDPELDPDIGSDANSLQKDTGSDPDKNAPTDHSDEDEKYLEKTDYDELEDDNHEESTTRFLTPEDCRSLREEAQQYYHRYIAMLVLEDYEAVVRDTSRNLRVLNLFTDYAIKIEDQHAMESHRPYIMMMRARSLASQALKAEESKAAIHAIDEGLEALRQYYESIEQPELFEDSGEVSMLRDMRDALIPKLPVSQKAELRQRLDAAIASENFELAAILRDEIRMLGGQTNM
jgi:UvrB/uvrC motif